MTEREFWARVTKTPFGCWTWNGTTHPLNAYGRVRVNGVVRYTHRVAYEIEYGPIPAGMHVLHDCDNPPCVNPRHLWAGTNADNQHDKLLKGRAARAGKLTKDDVPVIYRERARGMRVADISVRFGVAKRTIYHVLAGHTWQPFQPAAKKRAA